MRAPAEVALRDSHLDLHLSPRSSRRVYNDWSIAFEGLNYEISPTKRKFVSIVHHPNTQFGVVEHPPKAVWPCMIVICSLFVPVPFCSVADKLQKFI